MANDGPHEPSYISRRFESYMLMVDRGELEREVAIAALRDEIAYAEEEDGSV